MARPKLYKKLQKLNLTVDADHKRLLSKMAFDRAISISQLVVRLAKEAQPFSPGGKSPKTVIG